MITVTHGMMGALRPTRVKGECDGCGLAVPVYPGRYPRRCPNCGEELTFAAGRDPISGGPPPVSTNRPIPTQYGNPADGSVAKAFDLDAMLGKCASGDADVEEAVRSLIGETTTSGDVATPDMPMAMLRAIPPGPMRRRRRGTSYDLNR